MSFQLISKVIQDTPLQIKSKIKAKHLPCHYEKSLIFVNIEVSVAKAKAEPLFRLLEST